MFKRIHPSHFCALGAVICWALSYVYTKVAMLHFTGASLGFWRCAVASAVLLVVVLIKRVPLPHLRDIPKFILSGAAGFSVYLPFFNEGTAMVTSTTSCIVISTAPVITAIIAMLLFKEKLPFLAWVAIAMEFSGILILTLWDGMLSINTGIFWLLIAAFLLASYNIMQRKYSKQYSPLQITTYSFFAATAMYVMVLPESLEHMRTATQYQMWVVIFLGVFPSAVAYLLWTKGLGIARNTSDVANYMFLTPLLALVLGYTLMMEVPDTGTLVGGAVILMGLIVFNTANRRRVAR